MPAIDSVIKAGIKKTSYQDLPGWRATLTVLCGEYKRTYSSREVAASKETARKWAAIWAHESQAAGYVTGALGTGA